MTSLYDMRLRRVQEEMKKNSLEQLIISEPAALWYLTGEPFDPGERLTVLLIRAGKAPLWIINKLFSLSPENEIPLMEYADGEDGMGLLIKSLVPSGKTGIDKTWPSMFLLALLHRCPRLRCVDGSHCVDAVRAVKDRHEQKLMREASRINDRCMEGLLSWIEEGVTERACADHLRLLYKKEGCEDVSFPPIISFGANGADPHHLPDDTVLHEPAAVLIDIGCRKNRYCSDMTRTFFFGEPSEEEKQVHQIVREANEVAEAIIRPGISLKEVDKAARDHIAKAGYGSQFTHRLGHFIGQTDHEAGEVSAASPLTAQPGMIFSIEPGIYLPGRFGVRIEDLVLVTEEGVEILNQAPKDWGNLQKNGKIN